MKLIVLINEDLIYTLSEFRFIYDELTCVKNLELSISFNDFEIK